MADLSGAKLGVLGQSRSYVNECALGSFAGSDPAKLPFCLPLSTGGNKRRKSTTVGRLKAVLQTFVGVPDFPNEALAANNNHEEHEGHEDK